LANLRHLLGGGRESLASLIAVVTLLSYLMLQHSAQTKNAAMHGSRGFSRSGATSPDADQYPRKEPFATDGHQSGRGRNVLPHFCFEEESSRDRRDGGGGLSGVESDSKRWRGANRFYRESNQYDKNRHDCADCDFGHPFLLFWTGYLPSQTAHLSQAENSRSEYLSRCPEKW